MSNFCVTKLVLVADSIPFFRLSVDGVAFQRFKTLTSHLASQHCQPSEFTSLCRVLRFILGQEAVGNEKLAISKEARHLYLFASVPLSLSH